MKFRVATWNVNSIKVRMEHVINWCSQAKIDAICLQETKSLNENFPLEAFKKHGFEAVYTGQKQYNGVAILSPHKIEDVEYSLPSETSQQKRYIAVTIKGVRLINVYVPNGETLDSDKYIYKLQWLELLNATLKRELSTHPRLMIMGDFNIAPNSIDVYDDDIWQNRVLVSPPEREALQALCDLGLTDIFRHMNPDLQAFSWWNYRTFGYKRKQGLRIDHILTSKKLTDVCSNCIIDESPRKLERPSDHTVVEATFDI